MVLGAAQRSWSVAANKLRARLAGQGAAQLHCSSLAQHASPISLHHVSCNVANKHSSQRLSARAEHSFLRQSSGCRHSLSSSLTYCPLGETPNALASNKSLQPGPLLELSSEWAAVKAHPVLLCKRDVPGAGARFETCKFAFFFVLFPLSASYPSFRFCPSFWFFFLLLGKRYNWSALLAPVASIL